MILISSLILLNSYILTCIEKVIIELTSQLNFVAYNGIYYY